ncbi:MAG TPA: cytochrome c [Gemmatimonadaceae bacterium]|jgi:mono/diheme cytochrome c family protein|nr:cytochrome c [Gemmatimonadaceae bacterium]
MTARCGGVLLVAACTAGTAFTACTRSQERERVDFERMRVQQGYGLYGTSGSFANGQSMQSPPAGTISREHAAEQQSSTARAPTRDAPVTITPALLARGKDRFDIYCAVCHGAGAFGGSIVAENMGRPRPPSLRTAAVRAQPAQYLFDVATRGKGRMPPYAPQLSFGDRWAVVAYIRQLQSSASSSADQLADSVRARQIQIADSIALARGEK